MKPLSQLDAYRDRTWEADLVKKMGGELAPADIGGCFRIRRPATGVEFRVIAANDEGWDHVSVSLDAPRCPSWDEMEFVKRTFFREDEIALQLHVPPTAHINHHPYCLHLWRPHGVAIPLPPSWMIA